MTYHLTIHGGYVAICGLFNVIINFPLFTHLEQFGLYCVFVWWFSELSAYLVFTFTLEGEFSYFWECSEIGITFEVDMCLLMDMP